MVASILFGITLGREICLAYSTIGLLDLNSGAFIFSGIFSCGYPLMFFICSSPFFEHHRNGELIHRKLKKKKKKEASNRGGIKAQEYFLY